mgnify:CR=1 FL=1
MKQTVEVVRERDWPMKQKIGKKGCHKIDKK